MIVVFTMAAVLWGMGVAMKTPVKARWIMISLLFTGVFALHLILPDGHPLREGTGGDARLWLLIAGFIGLGSIYRKGLMWLRARTNPVSNEAPKKTGLYTEAELERYARHIILREIGGPGQKRLKEARVLVVGAGGLGSSALLYLAGSGVGTIGVIDEDVVDNSNLQRQIIHRDQDINVPKVFSAERAINDLNPFIEVKAYHRRLGEDIAQSLFAQYDLVLDGTDNFETRYLVNRMAVQTGIPLVSGALTQWEGQLSVFDPARKTPCYQCIFPVAPADGLAPSCAQAGVFAPLPGIIGTMMAAEAVKVISGAGTPLFEQLVIYDGLDAETRKIKIKPRKDCPICGPKVAV